MTTRVPASSDIVLSYAVSSNPFISRALAAGYVSQATILFRGTDVLGIPASIKVAKQASVSSPTHSIKIYDVTNSLAIAELTAQSSTTLDIVDMGTLSNLPTGLALFEIQVKRDSGGSTNLDLYGACITF